MAESFVTGEGGAVTLPASHNGRAFKFSLRATQNKKLVNRYGGSRFDTFYGGTINVSGDVTVFLRKGETATTAGITNLEREGAALTLQADTGVTIGGTALFDFSMNHDFNDPVIEGTYPIQFSGTVTEAWATA